MSQPLTNNSRKVHLTGVVGRLSALCLFSALLFLVYCIISVSAYNDGALASTIPGSSDIVFGSLFDGVYTLSSKVISLLIGLSLINASYRRALPKISVMVVSTCVIYYVIAWLTVSMMGCESKIFYTAAMDSSVRLVAVSCLFLLVGCALKVARGKTNRKELES